MKRKTLFAIAILALVLACSATKITTLPGVVVPRFASSVSLAQISISGTDRGRVVGLAAARIGAQGEIIWELSTGTASIDPPNIATVSRGAATFTLTGAAAGDIVVLLPPAALNDDLIFCGADVTGANTVTAYLYNPTAGAIDDAARTWRYLWFDLT